MEVIVSERGGIQIPNEIMKKMDLKPGDKVAFELNDDHTITVIKA